MATATERHLETLGRYLFEPLMRPAEGKRRWELVSWDVEQGFQLVLRRDDHLILLELEDRDPERGCYARTERFNICVRRHFEATSPLSDGDRRLVDAVVRMIAQREGGLPDFERPTTSRRASLREILVERVLIPEGAGHYYLNPYVGCMIGCAFCYVAPRADMSRRLEGLPELEWGRYVDVKVNAAEVLAEEVKRFPPGVVRMSPILTDPYQPTERRFRITRQCLEVLLGAGFTPVILTRAARVLEDLDLLTRFRRASVGFSIPTDDDHYRLLFEPGGDPVDARIDALARFHAAGLHTTAVIQPMLPMSPEALVERLAPIVHAVRIDRMHHLDRYEHLYREHDLAWAATDAFFDDLHGRLLTAFRARGVVIDEMDNLVQMLGLEGDG